MNPFLVKAAGPARRSPADPAAIIDLITDPLVPLAERRQTAKAVFNSDSTIGVSAQDSLLQLAAQKDAPRQYARKSALLDDVLQSLKDGPEHFGVFLGWCPAGLPGGARRARICNEEARTIHLPVLDPALEKAFAAGDGVIMDADEKFVKGRLALDAESVIAGQEARFERTLHRGRLVEVVLQIHEEKVSLLCSDLLRGKIAANQVRPGDMLLVDATKARMALDVIAEPNPDQPYKFLDAAPAPEVDAERDIGFPPPAIAEATSFVAAEIHAPAARRSFHQPRCLFRLFVGASGTGKSFAIDAIISSINRLVAEQTGLPMAQLPARCIRLHASNLYSKWLGESEKLVSQACAEFERLGRSPITTPDGRQFHAPAILVLEEIDGIGRQRGDNDNGACDRIMTVLLQRLDPSRLKDVFGIVLATSNNPDMIDAALVRRVGAKIEKFTRLADPRSFAAVLAKHVLRLPAAAVNGHSPEAIWRAHISRLAAAYYSPNSAANGFLEITLAGTTKPILFTRPAVISGALVQQAVQDAANAACGAAIQGSAVGGVTFEQLCYAFEKQFANLLNVVQIGNVHRYLDLPDGARVAALRKIPQPLVPPALGLADAALQEPPFDHAVFPPGLGLNPQP